MKKRKRLALIITTAVVVSMSMGNIAFAKTGVPVQEVEHIQYVSGEHNESKNQEVVEVQNTGEKEEQKDKESNIQDDVNIANMSKEDEAGVAVNTGNIAYLDTIFGSDNKDGTSAVNAVKSLEKALQIAGKGGTINVINSSVVIKENKTISNVTFKKGASYNDNILRVEGGATVTLDNVTIDGMSVKTGHTSVTVIKSSLVIKGNTKICNSLSMALNVVGGTVTMESGEICNNSDNIAGAILLSRYNEKASNFIMNGGSIHDNKNTDNEAGAIRVDENTTFTMNGGEIYNNTTDGNGGGIICNGEANLAGGVIRNNSANSGGGVSVFASGVLNISGTEISSNNSTWGAGVCAVGNSTVNLSGTGVIKNNTTKYNAAGVFLEGGYGGGTTFTMSGGTIADNTAGGNGGAILGFPWEAPVKISVSSGTITGNKATDGNGICISGDNSKVKEAAKLELSGSPNIADDIFLATDRFENAKVDVVAPFNPVTPVPIRDTMWKNYRTIVSYAYGVTPNIQNFSPADKHANQAIIQDGQNLQSVNKLTVDFAEKGYIADGNHTLYGTIMVLPDGTIPIDMIPKIDIQGYTVTEWRNGADDSVWDFKNDKVISSVILYPVLAPESPSNTALTELENAGFKKVNDLKATDYYNIETAARKDGFVDIAGASQENNANVHLWSNNGTAAQKFYFEPQSNGKYQIKTDITDGTSALEVDSGKVALGTNIKQYSDRNQNGTYFIAMKNDKNQYVFVVADKNGNPAVTSNGKVQLMDLTGAKVSNGTNIWTWEYIKGSNTQMWNLINTKSANEARAKGLTLVKDFAPGEYNIISAYNNNFALDVSGGKQSNGTNVGIWERNFADAEKFRIEKASENGEYYIRTAASGYKSSIDVSSASPNRGANVHQWASNNSNAQIWKIYKNVDGSYVFINSVNGKALDIAGGNVRKGQNVGVWDVNGILNAQHWKIESATTFDAANPELEKITDISSLGISEKDWVQLGSIADSSFRLDISSGIDANGQNVHIWKSNGTNAQKFRIKKLTNGNFVIQTRISNGTKVIDISGGNTNSRTNILQWSSNNTNAQQWNIYRVKGTDKLIFKQASGYCVMDTCGASMKNGSNIWLWFYAKDNGAQQWKIYK